jgi:hypothetical protein
MNFGTLPREVHSSYSEMLSGRLKPAIRTKCRGLLLKVIAKLHENARPQVQTTPMKASAN